MAQVASRPIPAVSHLCPQIGAVRQDRLAQRSHRRQHYPLGGVACERDVQRSAARRERTATHGQDPSRERRGRQGRAHGVPACRERAPPPPPPADPTPPLPPARRPPRPLHPPRHTPPP